MTGDDRPGADRPGRVGGLHCSAPENSHGQPVRLLLVPASTAHAGPIQNLPCSSPNGWPGRQTRRPGPLPGGHGERPGCGAAGSGSGRSEVPGGGGLHTPLWGALSAPAPPAQRLPGQPPLPADKPSVTPFRGLLLPLARPLALLRKHPWDEFSVCKGPANRWLHGPRLVASQNETRARGCGAAWVSAGSPDRWPGQARPRGCARLSAGSVPGACPTASE